MDSLEGFGAGPFTPDQMLHAVLGHPSLAVAAVRRGVIQEVNESWRRLFGEDPVEVRGQSVASLFTGSSSAARFERAIESRSEDGVAKVEHLIARRDGSTFMAEIVVGLVAGDNLLGADAVWQVRDVTHERELRREIQETEDYYRALSAHQWDLTLVVDRAGQICFVSLSVELILGYQAAVLVGERVTDYLHEDDHGPMAHRFARVLRGEPTAQREIANVRIRHADGSYRILSCRQKNCLDVARIAGVVVNARDITEDVRREENRVAQMRRSSHLRSALFDLATRPWTDFAHRIDEILEAACRDLDVQSASFWRHDPPLRQFRCEAAVHSALEPLIASPLRETIGEESYPLYVREIHGHRPIVVDDVTRHPAIAPLHLDRLRAANVGAMLDVPVARAGSTLGMLCLECAARPRIWDADEINFATGLSLLISLAFEGAERAAVAARTEYMAMHDSLTGLVNRNCAETELRRVIRQAELQHFGVGLLLIDIDDFKEINDTFGHAKGDALLARIARVLVECAGNEATVARMGGDEFLIVQPRAQRVDTERLAESIVERLGHEQPLSGIEQTVSASIGVAMYPDDARDAEALLANADIAMYQAKARGRNQYFAFNAALAQRLKLQRDLDVEIREALKHREFALFYQPQIDLVTGAVVGLEALLRWEHPVRGLLLPGLFMEAAEHNGLIDTITKWALTEACEQNVTWQKEGLAAIPVSVNVTGRQFLDRHLPAIIAGALMRSGLSARFLLLEVTEESLIENTRVTERVLKELRQLGIRIAIDDFGVGYSSLNYLRRLVVNQIKLDKAFIDGLPDNEESHAVVAAVIAIARQLKYQVVAEGIETKAQFEALRRMGCEAGQGFYFGAPLSSVEIASFLKERALAA